MEAASTKKHKIAGLTEGKAIKEIQLGPNGVMLDTEVIEKGNFDNFKITEKTKEVLRANEIKYLFPIQVATFKKAYKGKDIIARDRTGSGKTFAYSLPIIEKLRKKGIFTGERGRAPSILVLLPTRELAMQVEREIGKLKHNNREYTTIAVYGGTYIRDQIQKLNNGLDVVVATPGRLWDLIERRAINLSKLRTIILDETDQMLDIGFQEIIEKIVQTVTDQAGKGNVQHLLFSATMPSWVKSIAARFMKEEMEMIDLVEGQEVKTSTTVEHLSLLVSSSYQFISTISDVVSVYCGQHGRAIIFTETKREANDVMLKANLKVECQV